MKTVKKSRIGIDVGGTKILLVLFDEKVNKELYREQIATPSDYSSFIKSIIEMILKAENSTQTQADIGIGIPGQVRDGKDVYRSISYLVPNFIQDLERDLERSVKIANDANCFALSECCGGVADGYQSAFCTVLGTGVGAGLLFNKKILNGPNFVVGEWGKTTIPFADKKDEGKKLFQLISGSALLNRYKELSGEDLPFNIKFVSDLPPDNVIATQVLDELYDNIARALLGLVLTIDPEVIVLGGGLSNIESIYTQVPLRFKKFADMNVPYFNLKLNLKKPKFGAYSGVRGAALL